MKSIFRLLLFGSLLTTPLIAQQPLYQFFYSEESFTPLTGAASLNLVNLLDNFENIQVPLGFSFQTAGQANSQIWVGGLEGILMTENYDDVDFVKTIIFAYDTEEGFSNVPGAKISYRTIGTAPNRIFQIEWFKVGLGQAGGLVSFQVWLYETSNKIQIRLGPQTVTNPLEYFFNGHSPLTGLGVNINFANPTSEILFAYALWVQGLSSAPTAISLYNYDGSEVPLFGTSTLPSSQAVFTFLPAGLTSVVSPVRSEPLHIFPNPAGSTVHFSDPAGESSQIYLTDGLGRMVHQETIPAGKNTFELPSGLASGHYSLRRQQSRKTETTSLQVIR